MQQFEAAQFFLSDDFDDGGNGSDAGDEYEGRYGGQYSPF